MHRLNRRAFAGGFTLVEILAVVVILGIASAAIIPQLGSRDDLNTSAAARLLIADLIYAQNRSISQQKMHCVKFDTAANSYSVVEAASGAVITHPVTKDPYTQKFGPTNKNGLRDVTFGRVSWDGKTTIGFNELGSPYAVDGAVMTDLKDGFLELLSGDYLMTVTVEPYTGEISTSTTVHP